MPLRMAFYTLLIYQNYNRYPRQYLVYIGEEILTMKGELKLPDTYHRYRVIDLKNDLDCSSLLESSTNFENFSKTFLSTT
jgi:hypothetical protein